MQKPPDIDGPIETIRWMIGQAWRDLKSVYYANTPVWRWLKSGALVFLGFFVWGGASVVLSVRPEWTFLYLFMAYGFLLIVWGPLTHFGVVPLVLRLRRTAHGPVTRTISRHGSKINLTIFLVLVGVLAVIQPGIMLLEFSPGDIGDGGDVSGDVHCEPPADGVIVCEVHDAVGFDHAVVLADETVVARADEEPYRLEFRRDEIDGDRYFVEFRNADGDRLRRISRFV